MKTLVLTWFGICIGSFFLTAKAQESTSDTSDYEVQRDKVNDLLDARNERFGAYDESLRKKTGIFGLKTKKDMQASIDILLEIVETDHDIFLETKKLLSYKDQMLSFQEFETTQIKELADDYDSRINSYISTISKLQQDQENLRQQVQRLKTRSGIYSALLILGVLIALSVLGFKFFTKQKLTPR